VSAIVQRNGRVAMNSSFYNTTFCVFISFFTCICRSVAGYRMTDYTRKKEAEGDLERINTYIKSKRLSKRMPETLGRNI
jgi:hypothetical protein